jgi:3-deoxy-manno-octulosonate cytidylyltransferase (CMP-KDO synthetase)
MADQTARVTVVIPARYGSSRFPGKPLAQILGKPMIQHVYERAQGARLVDRVVVATDDERIRDAVRGFGGQVMMTPATLRTGTDRVAHVAAACDGEYFLNLQGDEIVLTPDLVTDLVEPFLSSGAPMGTLQRAIESEADLTNPAVVKVVTDREGYALYFSRAPIPHVRDAQVGQRLSSKLHAVHLGLYSFTRRTLERMAAFPTGRLEDVEKLEQLRALEHGIRIRVWETVHRSLRIDTPADLRGAEAVLQRETAAQA